MDPFTIVTGAAGLLSTIQGIINEAKPLIASWQDCPKELTELRSELQALETLLKDIKPVADRLRTRNTDDRNVTQPKAVSDIWKFVCEIKALLEPYQGPDNLNRVYNKPDKKIRLRWKSTKEDIQRLKDQISNSLDVLKLAVAADTSSGVMDANEKLDIIKDDRDEENEIKKRDEILEWLYPGDPGRRHNEVRGRLGEGTGGWIYETEQFKRWHETQTPWLLCQGDPGVGKTFITANIIHKMRQEFKGENFGIAYIMNAFADQETIIVSTSAKDIETYVNIRISDREFKPLDESLRPRIVQEVIEGSNRMFLLARYQTDHILRNLKKLEKHPRSVFSSMPKTVNDYFEQTLQRIIAENVESSMALNALMWISKATRPLNIDELSAALAFGQVINDAEDVETYEAEEIENACIGLVVIDKKSRFCRLAHQTVQEYLISKPGWTEGANFLIADTALKYIARFKPDSFSTRDSMNAHLKSNELYEYTAKNWGIHMQACNEQQNITLTQYLEDLFKADEMLMEPVIQVVYRNIGETSFGPLHTAAFWGLTLFTQKILPGIKDIGVCDLMYHQTPLSRAARNGHEAVVKLLIGAGAEAAENGHEAVVKLLIGAGAEVDSQSTDGRTPLSYAAEWGREAVVKLLVDAKADVDSHDTLDRTPLSHAAERGEDMATIEFLISLEAINPNFKDNQGLTPLSWAVMKQRSKVVELLVKSDKMDLDVDPALWPESTRDPDQRIMRIVQDARDSRHLSPQTPAVDYVEEEAAQEKIVQKGPTQGEPTQRKSVQEKHIQEGLAQEEPLQQEPVQPEPIQKEPVWQELSQEQPFPEVSMAPTQILQVESPQTLSTSYLECFGGRYIFLAFWAISCFTLILYFVFQQFHSSTF